MSRVFAAFEPHPEATSILEWFEWRFGLSADVFADHRLWHRPGSPAIWIAAVDCAPPPGFDGIVQAVGMIALRDPPPRGKPSSVFLSRFGARATRNVYDLDPGDAQRFLAGEPLAITPRDEARGYCVVRGAGRVLGCGRISGETLYSEIPRSWRETANPPVQAPR